MRAATRSTISSPATGRVEQWTRDVVSRLLQLRRAIEDHIEVTERPGGLYEEIIAEAPRLAARIRRLQPDHAVKASGAFLSHLAELGYLQLPPAI